MRSDISPASESLRAEVTVNEHTVDGLKRECAVLLGAELQYEQCVAVFVEQEFIATVHECGVELLCAVGVQAVVGKVDHVLHANGFYAHIFQFRSIVWQTEAEAVHIVQILSAYRPHKP